MSKRLTNEQLAAIRARVDLVVKCRARAAEAREKMNQNMGSISALRTFRALQELCVEAEEDVYRNAGEDIPALLAHIDAQGEMIARLSNELAGTHEYLQDIIDGNQTGSNDPLENYERLQEDLARLRELDMRVVQAARSLLLG